MISHQTFADHHIDDSDISETLQEAQHDVQQEVFRNAREKCKTPIQLLLLKDHMVILKYGPHQIVRREGLRRCRCSLLESGLHRLLP